MKLYFKKDKVIFWLSLIFLFLFSALLINIPYNIKQNIISSNKESLFILAREEANLINSFLESQIQKQEILANVLIFQDLIAFPNDEAKIGSAKKQIGLLKNIIPGISLLDAGGTVILGDIDERGTYYGDQPYFSMIEKKVVFELYEDPIRKELYYAVVGPIFSTSGKNKLYGVLAYDLDLDKISHLVRSTLEDDHITVYLVNEDGLLLGGTSYVSVSSGSALPRQTIRNEGVVDCLDDFRKYFGNSMVEEHEEDVSEYIGLDGVMVYGVHSYVPEIGACLMVEKSSEEIMKLTMFDYFRKFFEDWNKIGR